MRVRSPSQQRRSRRRRGVAAVEMAIILPLLVTIVLGCVDLGRFAHAFIAVNNAARAGAGFACLHPFTTTTQSKWHQQIRQTVETELGTRFDPSKLDVPLPDVSIEPDGRKRVRVEVSYPFETVVRWPLLPTEMNLRRAVEMRFIR
ncbi:MAG TPA: TadE family protein [Thermoguttaceae bacterium]|nr:TadE family protein [Thermoguttaceae bacterium]